MNILVVSDSYVPTISGVANSTESIARYLVSRKHTVTVICPAPIAGSTGEAVKGLTIVTAPSIKDPLFAGKPMTPFPLGAWVIGKAMRGGAFDVVHIQEPGSLGILALLFAKIRHIPTVGAEHTMPQQMATFFGPFYKFGLWVAHAWIRMVYGHYDAIMTPTKTMAQQLINLGVQVPIHPVSNGIDIQKYTPAARHSRVKTPFSFPKQKILFGYLGRIDMDKHLDIAIRAMTKTDPGVHLVGAGFGKEQEVLVTLAKELRVSDKVTFIGSLKEPEIIELYRELDCFIIPSPVESQSIVTLQAIASGLPVLAANAGALPELVHDGKNGFLVKTDDFEGFAQKMNVLAKDVVLRRKFSVESRRISITHDKPKALHKLEKLYLSLQSGAV